MRKYIWFVLLTAVRDLQKLLYELGEDDNDGVGERRASEWEGDEGAIQEELQGLIQQMESKAAQISALLSTAENNLGPY